MHLNFVLCRSTRSAVATPANKRERLNRYRSIDFN